MSEVKLLPCPFCGGNAKIRGGWQVLGMAPWWLVACIGDCQVKGPYASSQEAAASVWNQRYNTNVTTTITKIEDGDNE